MPVFVKGNARIMSMQKTFKPDNKFLGGYIGLSLVRVPFCILYFASIGYAQTNLSDYGTKIPKENYRNELSMVVGELDQHKKTVVRSQPPKPSGQKKENIRKLDPLKKQLEEFKKNVRKEKMTGKKSKEKNRPGEDKLLKEFQQKKREEAATRQKREREQKLLNLKQQKEQQRIQQKEKDYSLQQAKRREAQLKERANALYEEALVFYQVEQFPQVKEKLQGLEDFVSKEEFSEQYRHQIFQKVEQLRFKVEGLEQRQRAKQEQLEQEQWLRQEKEGQQQESYLQERQRKEQSSPAYQKRQQEKASLKARIEEFKKQSRQSPADKPKTLNKQTKPSYKSADSKEDKNSSKQSKNKNTQEKQFQGGNETTVVEKPHESLPKDKLNDEKHSELAEILEDRDLIQKQREEITDELRMGINKLYDAALISYKAKDYKKAKRLFRQVDAIQPNYKLTQRYLVHLEQQSARIDEGPTSEKRKVRQFHPRTEREELASKRKLLESLVGHRYEEAVRLFKNREYETAGTKFQQVEALLGNYKKTRNYLEQINNYLKKDSGSLNHKETSKETSEVINEKNSQ